MKGIFVFAVLAFCALADSGIFVPEKLPCSFSSDIIIELSDKTVTGKFYTADMFIAIVGTALTATSTTPIPMKMTYRPDILADGQPVQAQALQTQMSVCTEQAQFNVASLKTYLGFSFPYESVETGQQWNGIDCDMYRWDANYSVCATSSMRIVGINATAGQVTFDNYTLNTDDLTVFAIDRSFVGCGHEGVYEVPTTDPCHDDSSDPSSYDSGHSDSSSSSSSSTEGAASTINAFASVILAMVMGVLLMVF